MNYLRNTVSVCLVAVYLFVAATGFGATQDITGTVEQKGEIVVLFTPDETYVLKGSEMLPEMIGKKVKVTGTIEEKDRVKVLTVSGFEEANEK